MRESGGPAAQSGILFQNTVAALYLGDLCRSHTVPERERLLSVRVEAPQRVDDVVLYYADGRIVYVQAKETLRRRDETWRKLWAAFVAQYRGPAFVRGRDRLRLWVGELREEHRTLERLCEAARTSDSAAEWKGRLSGDDLRLLVRLRPVLQPPLGDGDGDEALQEFLGHVEVEMWPLREIENRLAAAHLPASSVRPQTLFRLLRDRVGGMARTRDTFRADALRRELQAEHGGRWDIDATEAPVCRTDDARDDSALDSLLALLPPAVAGRARAAVHRFRGWSSVERLWVAGTAILTASTLLLAVHARGAVTHVLTWSGTGIFAVAALLEVRGSTLRFWRNRWVIGTLVAVCAAVGFLCARLELNLMTGTNPNSFPLALAAVTVSWTLVLLASCAILLPPIAALPLFTLAFARMIYSESLLYRIAWRAYQWGVRRVLLGRTTHPLPQPAVATLLARSFGLLSLGLIGAQLSMLVPTSRLRQEWSKGVLLGLYYAREAPCPGGPVRWVAPLPNGAVSVAEPQPDGNIRFTVTRCPA